MKSFIKNFAMAIPLAIGIVLTIMSVVGALSFLKGGDAGFFAIVCGLIGIPLLYASIIALVRQPNT